MTVQPSHWPAFPWCTMKSEGATTRVRYYRHKSSAIRAARTGK